MDLTALFLLVIGMLLVAVAVLFLVVLPIWGTFDAAIRSDEAWRVADQNKLLWVALQVVLWGIGSIAYFLAIRPKLKMSDKDPDVAAAPVSRKLLPVLAATLLFLLFATAAGAFVLRPTGGAELSLDALLNHAESGRLSHVHYLDEDERAVVSVLPGPGAAPERFVVNVPREIVGETVTVLLENGVSMTIEQQRAKAVLRLFTRFGLPSAIAVNLLLMVFVGMRAAGGRRAVASSQAVLQ